MTDDLATNAHEEFIQRLRRQAADGNRRDAAERGHEYSENYVLSRWGQNRVYNYFVNGESEATGTLARRTAVHCSDGP